MTSLVLPAPPQVEALGRAALYSLCALGLATPAPARWGMLHSVVLPAIRSLELPQPVSSLAGAAADAAPLDPAALAGPHLRLFPPIASQDAPAYETAYRGQDVFAQVALLADVAGFYRAHGFRAGGAERERPDHIVTEVEFCAVVCRKEAHALADLGPEQVEVCRDTRAGFLRDHLGCWAPAFGQRVSAVAEHPFHRAVGALLSAWVDAELLDLGIQPVEVVERPLPQDPPDDGMCGPCPLAGGG